MIKKRKNIIIIISVLICAVAVAAAALIFKKKEQDFSVGTPKESNGTGIVETDELIYYTDSSPFIYVYDKNTGEREHLCSNLDCKRDVNSCNAYLLMPGMCSTSLMAYGEHLYYIDAGKDDSSVYLYRLAMDGSTRDKHIKICEFPQGENASLSDMVAVPYGQYIFLSTAEGIPGDDPMERISYIYKLDIKEGAIVSLVKEEEYGNYVKIFHTDEKYGYYYMYYFDKDISLYGKICRFNAETGEKEILIDETAGLTEACFLDGKIYYNTIGTGMYQYDIDTKKSEGFGRGIQGQDELIRGQMASDGEYIYMLAMEQSGEGEAFLEIYDKSGEKISRIDFLKDNEMIKNILCVDGKLVYILLSNDGTGNSFGYIYPAKKQEGEDLSFSRKDLMDR